MAWLSAYTSLNGVRLNMVVGPEGQFTDESGSSRGISNDTDRQLIRHLRSVSDVVVTGGKTARLEGYKPSSTRSLVVISSKEPFADGRITLNPPNDINLPAWVLAEIQQKGFNRILLEVGPSLAAKFLSEDLVDELCLTVPSGNLAIAKKAASSLNCKLVLTESFVESETLFTIWRRGNK